MCATAQKKIGFRAFLAFLAVLPVAVIAHWGVGEVCA
jgi:hypothetical protein